MRRLFQTGPGTHSRVATRPHALREHTVTLGAAVLVLVWASACSGGYAARIEGFRHSVVQNDLDTALAQVDGLIGEALAEGSAAQLEYPLLLLERASVLQAMDEHAAAVADFGDADQLLEILDLTPRGGESAGRYLWADDVGLYRPPVYEKLAVNLSALASYLALGDYRGARVEARRINVLAKYFEGTDLVGHPIIAAGNVLAGLAMELSGERDSALRFYFDAFDMGPTPQLAEWIVRLSAGSSLARRSQVAEARSLLGLAPDESLPESTGQEVIVLVFSGMAPRRQAERYPVGMVWAWATAAGYHLHDDDETVLERLMAEELLTWINFPVLVVQIQAYDRFEVEVGGEQEMAALLADMEGFALTQWEQDRGTIALAAITRAIVRVLAREAIQATGEAIAGEDSAGATAFFIASLLVQGGMQAADTPDTRTWTTMAARVSMARLDVAPGPHVVQVTSLGPGGTRTDNIEIDVPPGGSRVITLRIFP